MLFAVTVIPLGAGDSIVGAVAEVVQFIEDAGLNYQVNGASTVIEADWGEVMPVLRAAERALRERYQRVFMVILVDDHGGATDRLHQAVEEVEARLTAPIPLS